MSLFNVRVHYKGKPVQEKVAQVAGGGMTAEQLGEMYERNNAFPGAEKVEIQEVTVNEKLLPTRLRDIIRRRPEIARRASVADPKVTPKATVVARAEAPAPTEDPNPLTPHPGTAEAVQAERVLPNPPAPPVAPGREDGSQPAPQPVAEPKEAVDAAIGQAPEAGQAGGGPGRRK